MKGSGHSNYLHDEQKAIARQAVLDGRMELSPEQLLEQLDTDWVTATRAHQDALAKLSVFDMVRRPYTVPDKQIRPEKDKELTPAELAQNQTNQRIGENVRIATNNTETYGKVVEDLIYQDPILAALLRQRDFFNNDEKYSEALRVRRTLVSHGIFAAIVEFVGASDPAA